MYYNTGNYGKVHYPKKPTDSKAFKEYKKLMNEISKENKEKKNESLRLENITGHEMLSPKFNNIPTEESDKNLYKTQIYTSKNDSKNSTRIDTSARSFPTFGLQSRYNSL